MRKDYYNGSAQDIVKRFMRNINLFRAAMFAILFLSFAYCTYLIFATDKNFNSYFFVYVLVCVLIIVARRLHQIAELTMLNLILTRDCDPVKYAEVFLILRNNRWFHRRWGSSTLNIAQGYYFSGRFEDAYNTLLEIKSVPKQPTLALLYYNLFANCGAELKQPEFISYAQAGVIHLMATLKPKSADAKSAQAVLDNIAIAQAVQDKKYDAAIALVNSYQMEAQTPIQTISSACRLAGIYFEMGDYQNAKSRFEFVAQNGNKLYHVKRAQEKLLQCIVNAL